MLDILEELTKRTSYYLTVDYKDSMYDHVIDSKESIVLIMPERWFKTEYNHNPQKIAGYHLAGLFDLGEVYSPNISLRFTVYYFTKLKPETFKTGVFLDTLQNDEQIRPNGHAGVSYPVLPQSFPDKVYCYLEAIERWVNEGKRPKNTFYANFNELALSDFHYEKPYALRYTANSIRIQKMLSSEEVVPLSDLADIFEPPLDNLTEGTVIYLYNHDEFTYPLKKEYFRETYIGVPNFKIKKGDILLSSAAEGYQINFVPDEIAEDIYCPGLTIIVRAKEGVSPEYIFLYLKSETGKTIISPYNHGAVIKHIPANEISRLPIIPPKRSAKQYRKLFEDIFIAQNRLDVFSECFQPQEVDSIENILNDELCAKALANWFFCSPFMAVMRDMAARYDQNRLPYPVFGLVYGQSKAGKTTFLETLLKMMIGQKPKVSAPDFTRSSIDNLKHNVKGAPIIVDDLTSTRFNQHAIETIKNDDFGVSEHLTAYPAVVISANEDVKAVSQEVIRRTVICRVEAGLTNTEVMKSNIVRSVQQQIGTAFYREYLSRMLQAMPGMMDALKESDTDAPDILKLSSEVIVSILSEYSEALPEYIRPLSLADYFSEQVTGKYAIKTIQNAWRANRRAFTVDKRNNELRYNAGAPYEADRLMRELPETLEAHKSRDCVIMNLSVAKDFFDTNFRRRLF